MLTFTAVVAGTSAIGVAGLSRVLDPHPFSGIFDVDGWIALPVLALGLLFWLMRRMTAVRMTTRYLIAPLIANLLSLAFLRPQVQLRSWLGLLLIALGSGWLLLAPAGEPEQTGSSLGIS
jgi:drug/metabolite transporter (DMT)-like permease